ncbi:hypothetical protein [Qipengyuania sediminis]|uniref:hypothetical protein n=1 Tax=Qipengyuania sediminis TaxID=1532023 RepID=UPI00105A0932|nr:hypothetical protein [Qipengyuania sediminis]
MRAIIAASLAALLWSCAGAPRDTALAGLDLADGRTLARLQAALPPDDRGALGTYALLHWPRSQFYCGDPIGGVTREAKTVGEAIDQTRAYEARLAKASAPKAAPTRAEQLEKQEQVLTTRIDRLVLERDMLYARLGPAAASSSRKREIEQAISATRSKLEKLRA